MSTVKRGTYLLGILLLSISLGAFAQAPSVSITPSGPVVCAGTQLTAVVNNLNATLTYQWSNGATTASITINQSAFIRVRVTGTTNAGATRTINSSWTPFLVIPNPNASVTPTGPVNLCPGQSTTLSAAGGQFFSSYLWNNGATTNSINVSQSAFYNVTITNSFFTCTTASTSNLVEVNVFDSSYEPAITADGPVTVCKPGYVPMHAAPGFSNYLWSTGATSESINVLMDGLQQGPVLDTLTVFLSVTLNNSCTFSNNTGILLRSIREPHLRTPDCGNLTLTMADSIKSDLVLSYGGYIPQYEFEFEETTQPTITWTFVSNSRWCNLAAVSPALQAGKFYNVRVRTIIGGTPYCYGNFCQIGIVATPAVGPTASRLPGTTIIESTIFPNPSSEDFQLVVRNLTADQQALVQITDLSGRLMNNFIVDSAAGSIQFGKELSTGIYLVSIRQGDNSSVTRIVKTN